MNSPSLSAQGPLDPSSPITTVDLDAPDRGACALARDAVGAPRIEASRGGPPPEVALEIAAACAIAEQLSACGYEMRFFPAEPGERARIEIHDRDGNSLCTLSAAEAVQMAAEPARA
ncbi:MAG TPA: hypothetical protein VL979_04725 [Solirubrobacteraceae bacterium]|nr:hypothetical protein [Solirubrobacteraceae bacterium]